MNYKRIDEFVEEIKDVYKVNVERNPNWTNKEGFSLWMEIPFIELNLHKINSLLPSNYFLFDFSLSYSVGESYIELVFVKYRNKRSKEFSDSYECLGCQKTFTYRQALKKYLKFEIEFRCPVCQERLIEDYSPKQSERRKDLIRRKFSGAFKKFQK